MIAKNFMKYPEALRFQHELFFNGYRNSPRIMRLMECIFDQRPSAPDWWTNAKARARNLAKRVKKSIADFFKETKVIQLIFSFPDDKSSYKKPEVIPTQLQTQHNQDLTIAERWRPNLRACIDDQDMMGSNDGTARMGGYYKRFCRAISGYQGSAKRAGNCKAYWGGFSE